MSIIIDPEPIGLIRCYKETTQRVPPVPSALNTHASFVLYDDTTGKVFLWHGKLSSPEDRKQCQIIAKEIRKEIPEANVNVSYMEIVETEQYEASGFYEFLGFDRDTFNSPSILSSRVSKIANAKKSLGTIQFIDNEPVHFVLWTELPSRDGTVPIFQLKSVYSDAAILTLESDNFWDVWVGDNVSDEEFALAYKHISKLHLLKKKQQQQQQQQQKTDVITSKVEFDVASHVRTVLQYHERIVFRSQFFPDDRFGSSLILQPVEDEVTVFLDVDLSCSIAANFAIATGSLPSLWDAADWTYSTVSKSLSFSDDSVEKRISGTIDQSETFPKDYFLVELPCNNETEVEKLRGQLLTYPELLIGWQILLSDVGVAVVVGVIPEAGFDIGSGKCAYQIKTPDPTSSTVVVVDTQYPAKLLSLLNQQVANSSESLGGNNLAEPLSSRVTEDTISAIGHAWATDGVNDNDPTLAAAKSLSTALATALQAVKDASAVAAQLSKQTKDAALSVSHQQSDSGGLRQTVGSTKLSYSSAGVHYCQPLRKLF